MESQSGWEAQQRLKGCHGGRKTGVKLVCQTCWQTQIVLLYVVQGTELEITAFQAHLCKNYIGRPWENCA